MRKATTILGFVLILACGGCYESVESGDQYEQFILPDGSEVFLNKYSRIQFKGDFDEERIVFLEGEAYFKVTSQDAPFLINTGYGEVLITGTEFNVNSKDGELAVEVDEGSVEINTGKIKKTIHKGERAVTSTANDISVSKANGKFKQWLRELEQVPGKAEKKIGESIETGERAVEKGAKKAERQLDKVLK